MSPLAFVTLGTHDYAPQSRVFGRTVRRFHPEARSILFAVENDAHPELYGDIFDEIVTCPDIGVPTLADMAFRYSQAELCFALKPWLLLHLLRRKDYEAILYFDSDIELFSPLTEAMGAIATGANLVLTPHVTVPPRQTDHVTDNSLLKSGACNAGFLAVSTRPQAEQFLSWWATKTQADAGHDPERGTYGDQKWLDLAPSLLDKVTILRHLGYNVAYWNCQLRAMTHDATGWSCAGEPLRFFHYSRWNMATQSPEDYLRAFFPPGCAFILPFLVDYAGRIKTEPVTPKDACSALATFHLPGGETIPAIVKSAYMRHVASKSESRERVVETALETLNAPSKVWPQRSWQTVTVLFDWIWRSQPEEWRREHDLATAAGWQRFKAWLRGGGAAYYAIPPAFLGSLDGDDKAEAEKPAASRMVLEVTAPDSPNTARRDNQMLLARILDLEKQLERHRKSVPSPLKGATQPTPDGHSSIWRKGLAFLRERRSSAGDSADFATYWGEDTVFRKFFDMLDHTDIVQFGCANGEHAAILLQHYRPRTLVLVDGDPTNIDACTQRFAGRRNIIFARDAGADEIADGSRSAAFSYDHLIRLEHDDVAACLITIGRILQPGKYALLHHSANDEQPGVAAVDSRGGRAFMSPPLFSHLCARAGLFIVESAKAGELDGLSLVQRISPLN
jgi:hypothetical protein